MFQDPDNVSDWVRHDYMRTVVSVSMQYQNYNQIFDLVQSEENIAFYGNLWMSLRTDKQIFIVA